MCDWLPMETEIKASLGYMRPCIKTLKSNQESWGQPWQGRAQKEQAKKVLSFFSAFEFELLALLFPRRVNSINFLS